MFRNSFVVPLILAVGFAVPSALRAADEAVVLRYQLDPNDALIYRQTMSLDQEQTVATQKIVTKMETTEIGVRTLEKVDDDGNLHVQTENERLKVFVEIGPLGKYVFDSESNERDKSSTLGAGLTPLYESLSGAYLWATISPRGEIVKTRGYAELVKAAVEEHELAKQFASGGGEEAYRTSLGQVLATFPKEAISPGDDWTNDIELKLAEFGNIVGKTKYTFEKSTMEKGHRVAEFSVSHNLGVDLDLTRDNAKVTGRLQTEKSEGTLRFDVTAGRLLSRNESFTLAGTLSVAVADQNLTIPMKQTQTVKVELLDELPE